MEQEKGIAPVREAFRPDCAISFLASLPNVQTNGLVNEALKEIL
ncbi:hypothetical protein [Paenibacillus riograndensis]|nr:hypothetical protein [Paenibacillus riograndensis]